VKCLTSIVNQTFQDIELICVNDGSVDNSLDILKKLASVNSKIKIIDVENGGLSSARNIGLDNCSLESKYIFFVDSDDWIAPNMLELALIEIERDEEIDIVLWGARVVAADDSVSYDIIRNHENYHHIKFIGKHEINDNLLLEIPVTVWNKLFKKELIEKYNIRFPVGLKYEDNAFFYKYVLHAKHIYCLNEYLYNYLVRSDSIMGKSYNMEYGASFDNLKVFEIIYLYYKENNVLQKHKELISTMFVRFLMSDYIFSPSAGKHEVLSYATKLSYRLYKSIFKEDIIENLQNRKYKYILREKRKKESILSKMFSVKKTDNCEEKYTIIRFFWIKFKIKKHKKFIAMINLYRLYRLKKNYHSMPNDASFDFKTDNHDKKLLDEIMQLQSFQFLPNHGNLGDVMISCAQFQYFEAKKNDYTVYNRIIKSKEPFNFVYGGGGLWYNHYESSYQSILDIFKSPLLKKCIIMPSSFYCCEDVMSVLDERFVVFCREEQSLNYCRENNKKATFILADDMVINDDFNIFQNRICNTDNLNNFFKGNIKMFFNIVKEKYLFYQRVYKKAEIAHGKYINTDIGYLLRVDSESNISDDTFINVNQIDVSNFSNVCCGDKGLDFILGTIFLSVIDLFNIVITDRLHIGICAAKLGKEVLLIDNSYRKLSNVYKNSLQQYPNVKMTTIEDLKIDLEQAKQKNRKTENDKIFQSLPKNIEDFIIRYASING